MPVWSIKRTIPYLQHFGQRLLSEREALQETLIMLSGMGLFTDVGSKEDRDCDGRPSSFLLPFLPPRQQNSLPASLTIWRERGRRALPCIPATDGKDRRLLLEHLPDTYRCEDILLTVLGSCQSCIFCLTACLPEAPSAL
ncbi:uncharacterized protein BT62DRAFT_155221 [Guyanagaster necrorhizus]|uniref:Uncharacterized protein n=1 Tax=Guyanagaster necrorhizus TaxID=856835 RepID=A0A9P8ASQ2_9AGAR|nr:uncharacterized protein BT62DRAFT_155221 [Guyanagaster necrorhizus MCA 3950]KAG7446151.1 hypothetical protein BT62DRAFT_155221 [Guyanagaster necrorhizus MCA 3950]